ncbi:putative protein TPRXL isoform X2 [Etheostoma cragini]|uniref:putative protein TPRXL isoform X2 n=1 Tax=Etheostoma cragini TaxID=417921 RepID=UPI00155EF378|nr:putative protein TPRXL isoform X2 [Etheostoma cragini]
MEACRSLLKSALVVIVLVAMFQSGSAEKLATCCTKVTKQKITEPILGYLVQQADPPCVQAVIFQTKSGLFCSYLRAPWVYRTIAAFEKAKAQAAASSVAPSTPVSLLSIITSTASPSTSPTPPSSSSLPLSSSTFPASSSFHLLSSSSLPASTSSALPASSSTFPASSSFHLLSSSSAFPSSSSSTFPASSSPSSPTTSETPAGETFSTAGSSVYASSLDA